MAELAFAKAIGSLSIPLHFGEKQECNMDIPITHIRKLSRNGFAKLPDFSDLVLSNGNEIAE